jgi:hypothetical protein
MTRFDLGNPGGPGRGHRGPIALLAAELGVSRSTAWRRLKARWTLCGHLPFDLRPLGGSEWISPLHLGEGGSLDPEPLETGQTLDEAFENIVVVETPPPPDDDWMAGEFDIT